MFQDYIFYGAEIKTKYAFRMCHLSNLARFAQKKHLLSPQHGRLLADGLLGGILLASLLEDEERINLRIQLGSEFTLGSETTCHSETKGYLEFDPGSLLPSALDEGLGFLGTLVVRSMRSQMGTGKLFEGVTQSSCGTVEEALNHHLKQSYQVKAYLRMQSWLNQDQEICAFGFVVLELPNLDKKIATDLRNYVSNLPNLREIFEKSDDPDMLAKAIVPHEFRAIKSIAPEWRCTCSQEAIENMVKKLSKAELSEMVTKGEDLQVRCHYCNTNYTVTIPKLKEIIG